MEDVISGNCAVCRNPLIFRVLTENQEVPADTIRECVINDDFADLYIMENEATSVLQYRCAKEGCQGALSENDSEILEGLFHPVNVS